VVDVSVVQEGPSRVTERPDPVVEVVDFARPTTLAREHSRILELAMETFSRQWGTHLTARVRVKSRVTSEHVIMQTYDEYAASLPVSTAMVLCTLDGHSSKAVIQFPIAAGLGLVVLMLGGAGAQRQRERNFTQIEQSLVRRLMEDALENLRYSLESLLSTPISFDTIQYNSQFAQAAAPSDLMIVSAFTIDVGGQAEEATVAIPAEILLPHLGAANPLQRVDNARELIREHLAQLPVEVSLRLAPAKVRPSTILNLTVGDVLPLPHPKDRPVLVSVDGQELANAALGAKGSRLAGVIVSTEENPR
jgi:flagellar motor switch protein FliM